MARVLLDSFSGVASPAFSGLNGFPVSPDATPTATCTRLDGTLLAAPAVSAVESQTGRFYAALTPDHTDRLDILTVEWQADVSGHAVKLRTLVYVCEDILVPVARLAVEPDMAKPPAWLLAEMADEVTDYCEAYCGVAFGRRLEREVLPWQRGGSVSLRWAGVRSVTSVVGDGNVITPSTYELRASVLHVGSWPWTSTVVVYEHGRPVPPKLAREALNAAREAVLSRAARTPRQAISETVDGTVVRFSTPDYNAGRPTGYLQLDPVLEHERVPLGVG